MPASGHPCSIPAQLPSEQPPGCWDNPNLETERKTPQHPQPATVPPIYETQRGAQLPGQEVTAEAQRTGIPWRWKGKERETLSRLSQLQQWR